jgi:hypothetical protein
MATNGRVGGVPHHAGSPYQSVGDFLSNTDKFQIIESTLREGEQFANAFFDTGIAPSASWPRLCREPCCQDKMTNAVSEQQRPRSRCVLRNALNAGARFPLEQV